VAVKETPRQQAARKDKEQQPFFEGLWAVIIDSIA